MYLDIIYMLYNLHTCGYMYVIYIHNLVTDIHEGKYKVS